MTNTTNFLYQPTLLSEQNNLSQDDCRDIEESIKETEANQQSFNKDNYFNKREGFIVKGKVSMVTEDFWIKDFPENKEDVAYHLASVLEDEESIAYYKKLSRERRGDFLKNCLRVTLEAHKNNKIKTTIAKYFTGIVKYRTGELERVEEYKRTHYFNKR